MEQAPKDLSVLRTWRNSQLRQSWMDPRLGREAAPRGCHSLPFARRRAGQQAWAVTVPEVAAAQRRGEEEDT